VVVDRATGKAEVEPAEAMMMPVAVKARSMKVPTAVSPAYCDGFGLGPFDLRQR
jgi:hypothetical protein